MAATSENLSMKLLIDRKSNRVLFAEAGKELVDFLFSLITLPVGSVIRLSEQSDIGCLGKLCESVEQMSDAYIQQNQKDLLLKGKPIPSIPTDQIGYVSNAVKYVIMDDLVICPIPTISAIFLLKLSVTNASSLKEVEVDLGVSEGMELLKAIVRSKTLMYSLRK